MQWMRTSKAKSCWGGASQGWQGQSPGWQSAGKRGKDGQGSYQARHLHEYDTKELQKGLATHCRS
eukprot:1159183-Pelagomonas_calceolata.AAC.13